MIKKITKKLQEPKVNNGDNELTQQEINESEIVVDDEFFKSYLLVIDSFSEINDPFEKMQIVEYHIADIKKHLTIFEACGDNKQEGSELNRSPMYTQFLNEMKLFKSEKKKIKAEIESYKFKTKLGKGNKSQQDSDRIVSIITHKLVLFYELGIWDLLNARINENGGSKKDLEILVSQIIDWPKPDSVGRYFPYMTNSMKTNKNSPFTEPAILKMKKILQKCNIKIKSDYPS